MTTTQVLYDARKYAHPRGLVRLGHAIKHVIRNPHDFPAECLDCRQEMLIHSHAESHTAWESRNSECRSLCATP